MFKRNDRIKFVHPQRRETVHGVVAKVAGGKATVMTDDLETFTGPVGGLQGSDKPVPEPLLARLGVGKAFAKGDRVCFDHRGETLHGVVTKGGAARIVVVLDGGRQRTSGPAAGFRASDKPLPKDPPSEMDRWGVVDHRASARMSEETEAFTATVTYDGKPVAHARNDGRGGCNLYQPLPGQGRDLLDRLHADAAEWTRRNGGEPFEPEDDWLSWAANERPFGVTAADHFAERARLLGRTP